MTSPDLASLADLLRRRLALIADHEWRDRDADGHLEALKSVSEEIAAAHAELQGTLPPRLEHFMSGCSYTKALEFIEANP
jgi:hypothetical protein